MEKDKQGQSIAGFDVDQYIALYPGEVFNLIILG